MSYFLTISLLFISVLGSAQIDEQFYHSDGATGHLRTVNDTLLRIVFKGPEYYNNAQIAAKYRFSKDTLYIDECASHYYDKKITISRATRKISKKKVLVCFSGEYADGNYEVYDSISFVVLGKSYAAQPGTAVHFTEIDRPTTDSIYVEVLSKGQLISDGAALLDKENNTVSITRYKISSASWPNSGNFDHIPERLTILGLEYYLNVNLMEPYSLMRIQPATRTNTDIPLIEEK